MLVKEDEFVLVEEWMSRAWPATQPSRKTGSLGIGWPVVTHINWWCRCAVAMMMWVENVCDGHRCTPAIADEHEGKALGVVQPHLGQSENYLAVYQRVHIYSVQLHGGLSEGCKIMFEFTRYLE